MTVVCATESGGYLYHEGTNIRAVAFAPLPELSACAYIIIPEEWASRFVRRELDYRSWFVWNNRLFQSSLDVLELPDDDQGFIKIAPGGDRRISLCLAIQRPEQRIVAHTDLEFERYTMNALPLLFVRPDDPSVVLFTLALPLDELRRHRRFEAKVPFDLNQPFDIYTQRLFPDYVVYDDDENLRTLPSDHFIDLMKFESGHGDGLHVTIDGRLLKFRIIGDGKQTYQRHGLDKLRLLFSEVGDPSLLLHAATVPVTELDGAELVLPSFVKWPFDIWSQMLFRHAYANRASPSPDLIKFENGTGRGLHAVVRGHSLKLRVDDDAQTYEPVNKIYLLFSKVDNPSLLLHAAAVPVTELDGAEIVLPADLERPFDIWTLMFRNAYVEYDVAH